ncbi:helix-turn-helix domain-containing protein [Lentilactobacillus kisonensis]|uniref:Transcriptional regulator, AraC family n=1 Tax=Lentilactobacillus kisonensis F0435 TaxID=797516 RepID=H1LEM7_9LACO|nr:helix-turn-helix domain-containing protein [Lentilactobacillus kisonensis]EHO52372.1 transcriptional regulator, AraC family [Lentilactobacillus kisonensis F0435]
MADYQLLLAELRNFVDLSIIVCRFDGQIIQQWKPTMANNFPKAYLAKIQQIKQPAAARLYIISANENLSVIRYDSEQVFIVLWSVSKKMSIDKNFEDHFTGVSTNHLISITRFLYYGLFNRFPENLKPISASDTMVATNRQHESILESNQENGISHNNYFLETNMLESIKNGDLAKFEVNHEAFIKSGSYGQLVIGNELRQKKDLAITATTLFTRAAIRGGLPPDAAFALSDSCIQKIEAETLIESVNMLIRKIGYLFIERVRNHAQRASSIPIYLVKDYIYKHLHERILLVDLAKSVNCSVSYLCKSFKKETGMTISNYIAQQRVGEIESYLIFTQKSLTEIAIDLGFHDLSYLTKTFKKVDTISPTQFRSKYRFY